jgi:hypothetical protein
MNKIRLLTCPLVETAARRDLNRTLFFLLVSALWFGLPANAQVGRKGKPVTSDAETNSPSSPRSKPGPRQQPSSSRAATKTTADTPRLKALTTQSSILIWKVGSPHEGDTPEPIVPLDIQLAAKQLNYRVEIETFPARGFASRYFEAVLNHQEPDILAFDNSGIIKGITTRLGNFAGIGTDSKVRNSLVSVSEALRSLESGRGGWEYLISTSRNHEAARKLVLNNLKCDPDCAGDLEGFDKSVKKEVVDLAVTTSQAYFNNDREKLRAISGGEAELDSVPLARGRNKINHVSICGLWGNVRLAFVYTSIYFEGDKSLGQKQLVIVLRKGGVGWEVLSFSGYRNVVKDLHNQVPSLNNEPFNVQRPRPLILNPPDKSSHKRWPNPEIEWRNVGQGIAVYLVQAQFGDRQNWWPEGAFWLISPRGEGESSIKVTAPFGVGAQPHRWRVWTIFNNGDVSLSEWRTILYTT